jgi:hypothetical protein
VWGQRTTHCYSCTSDSIWIFLYFSCAYFCFSLYCFLFHWWIHDAFGIRIDTARKMIWYRMHNSPACTIYVTHRVHEMDMEGKLGKAWHGVKT